MKEQTLLMLDGYYVDYHLHQESQIYKVIAILEENQSVFKGIGISSEECDLEDEWSIIQYIKKNFYEQNNSSLLAGYWKDGSIYYSTIHSQPTEISFGNFEWNGGSYLGREKSYYGGKLRRNLKQLVNKYDNLVITNSYPDLYEVLKSFLALQQKNSVWQGIQYSIENSAPKNEFPTFPLIGMLEMTYDYHDGIKLAPVLGFLDKRTKIFTGLQIESISLDMNDLDSMKKKLMNLSQSTPLIYGIQNENFKYYTFYTKDQSIHYNELRMAEEGYVGTDCTLENGKVSGDILYKTCSQIRVIEDFELAHIVSFLLQEQMKKLKQSTFKEVSYITETTKKEFQKMKK